ncbi:unnamed protein product [Trichobilharzia szidati]|nr:unnamed protein product [Trichobilharzia szidati]CAH8825309.1 unnamed protein product [Trichobilharzia szidati]
MDFQTFQTNANNFFGRVIQMTEEAFSIAERTPLDAALDELIKEGEKRRKWAESLIEQTENMIQPNPAQRVEDLILKNMDRKKIRISAGEQLGDSMNNIGDLLGARTPGGSALKTCAASQIKIGQAEQKLQETVTADYIEWLRAYISNEAKIAKQERENLETARLDLDRLKTVHKRAKNDKQKDLARQLEEAQLKFNRQCAATKKVLEESVAKFDSQKGQLEKLLQAQSDYFRTCMDAVNSALREL